MRRTILGMTLRVQFMAVLAGCVLFSAAGATLLVRSPGSGGKVLAAALLAAGGVSFVLAAIVVSRVIRSLQALRGCVDAVIAGNLSIDPSMPPSSRDLGELHSDFRRMVVRLRQSRSEHEQSRRSLADRTKRCRGDLPGDCRTARRDGRIDTRGTR